MVSFSFRCTFSLIALCALLSTQCFQSLQLRTRTLSSSVYQRTTALSSRKWDGFDGLRCDILSSPTVMNHLGETIPTNDPVDDVDRPKREKYNRNVGKALETLRRELPIFFHLSSVDFSIFANQITVGDSSRQNKMMMSKSLYVTAVKSVRMAAAISSMYPSMNVRKIEYVEDVRTIQCLVDVVLPDSVRVDGQAVWKGMFYFGLDSEGLIDTHIFDRKISNFDPKPLRAPSAYPWIRAQQQHQQRQDDEEALRRRAPVPQPQYVSFVEDAEER